VVVCVGGEYIKLSWDMTECFGVGNGNGWWWVWISKGKLNCVGMCIKIFEVGGWEWGVEVGKNQVNSMGRDVIAYCKLHNFVVKQKCIFFLPIDLSHYSVPKSIKV